MRKSLLLVIATMLIACVSTANAAVTCKIIPSWCPRDNDSGSSSNGDTSSGVTKTSVPEPSTVLLLGTGLLGVGFVVYRRSRVAVKADKS